MGHQRHRDQPVGLLRSHFLSKVTNAIRCSFAYSFGPATMASVHLDPGKVYDIDIPSRNSDGSLSCFQEARSMRGNLPQ